MKISRGDICHFNIQIKKNLMVAKDTQNTK
jgi:hypothetical protein